MTIPVFKFSLLLIGLSGMTAQIVLLRELLVSFLGNELTLGVILANWLILVAIGSSLIGKSVERVGNKLEIFVILQMVLSVAFPLAILLCRVFKNVLLTGPGEALGFGPIFYSSFLILSPVALPYGFLFTYGCKLYAHYHSGEASPAGRVYLLETMGSMIGGLLLTFLLVQYFNPFTIAFLISSANSLMSIFLLFLTQRPSKHFFQKGLMALSILLCFLFTFGLSRQVSSLINQTSIRAQWKGLDIIHYENSIYGNITVAKRGEQVTFFTDGVPSITAPVPDISFVEDFVHFPMLFHEKPESILILNGGAGGVIHEVLKYPVTRLDYVELDPLLLTLVQKFPTPLTQSELSDPRVKIHYMDGRLFVQSTAKQFDLIFVGLSAPQSLQTNRLFSAEFFSLAKEKMTPNSILALTLPGSLTYISPELRDLNGCILDTLKAVYRRVRVVPGDVNLYLASDSASLEKISPDEISKRFGERNIQTSLINRDYIEYRLNQSWLKWFRQSMEGRRTRINSDFLPSAVFFNLSYWNRLFSPCLTGVFKWYENSGLTLSIAEIILITLILATLFIKMPRLSRYSILYSILTTGLTGMIFSLAMIFAFQTLYGYLYHQIGLLIAIFMFGIASGSFFITKRFDRVKLSAHRAGLPGKGYHYIVPLDPANKAGLTGHVPVKNESRLFFKIEIGLVFFSFLFPFVFLVPSPHLENRVVYVLLYGAFLIMSFLSGIFIGLQFPLANNIYSGFRPGREMLGQTAGLIYGADLFGGFFGGLFGGVLLLPVLGLKETCFIMALIKISSGILFFLFLNIQKTK